MKSCVATAPHGRSLLLLATLALMLIPGASRYATGATPQPAMTGSLIGGLHKIRVSDPQVSQQLAQLGAKLVSDYTGFQYWWTPIIPPGWTNNPQVEIRDGENWIQLNMDAINTTLPEAQAARLATPEFVGRRLYLVQFAAPVRPEWYRDLVAGGLQPISYIPAHTYLVYADAKALAGFQQVATQRNYVQWSGPFLNSYKMKLESAQTGSNADWFAIQLVLDPEVNAHTLDTITGLALEPIRQQDSLLNYLNLVARLKAIDLEQIAACPDVISIAARPEPQKLGEREAQIAAGNLAGNVPGGPGYLEWLAASGFTSTQFAASGFIVDVADSGIDNGTPTPDHFGLHATGDINLSSRVAYNRLEGTPHLGSTLQGCDGHGNLNAHIIGGFDAGAGFPHTDTAGFHYGLGLCPFVRVGSSVIFDPNQFTYPSYPDMLSRAYQSGARISNNSWGFPGNGYGIDAQSYDVLVRDAQPTGAAAPAAGNQEMVIIFAVGNSGPGMRTIASPATAKNVISVGASQSVQPFGASDSCDTPDNQAANAGAMYPASSRGPCGDGRHKPDLVAPGTHVSGGLPQTTGVGTNGNLLPCFTGSGICGGPSGFAYPSGQSWFTASSGTSHAAPVVAGACALLRQFFLNQSNSPPSPALTKAYLMNAARNLTADPTGGALWSDTQGMGGLNIGMAFDGAPRILRDQLPEDTFTASGQSRTYTGLIAATNKPFRVTVAWTDAPGSTIGSAYNNDLDLVVTVGTNSYKGNVFNGPISVPGGAADSMNNVESVFLPAGLDGKFQVSVTAANINSTGVPGQGISLNQDFALVIYNAKPASGAAIVPRGLTLESPPGDVARPSIDPGATATVQLSLQNVGWEDATNLVATMRSGNGVTPLDVTRTYGPMPAGGAVVARSFQFTGDGDCGNTLTLTLGLQDGLRDLGTATFQIALGGLMTNQVFNESFESVLLPSLPLGWSTSSSGAGSNWISVAAPVNGFTNAVFAKDGPELGLTELVSPLIHITSGPAAFSFQHQFDLEAESDPAAEAYDGGLLEVSVSGRPWTDVITGGFTFRSGGYNRVISTAYDNPLAGRAAWSGQSGGIVNSVLSVPVSAQGQDVQFRWRCGTDGVGGAGGWYVDRIQLVELQPECAAPLRLNLTSAAAGTVLLRFQSRAAMNYTLEYKNALSDPEWSPIPPAIPGDGNVISVPIVVTNSPARYYRVSRSSSP